MIFILKNPFSIDYDCEQSSLGYLTHKLASNIILTYRWNKQR